MTGADGVPAGRIAARFARLAAERRAGFVPYVTAGYPTMDHTRDLLAGLAEVGADVIEVGIPFSDPMADGPTIQRSSQGALDAGATTQDVFDAVAGLRRRSEVPVVIFSYLNPIVTRGAESFVQAAVEAGADGVLPTDLPLGADPELEAQLASSPLDLVRLIAPTTTPDRIRAIARASQGFAYYIARTGVTGCAGGAPRRIAARTGGGAAGLAAACGGRIRGLDCRARQGGGRGGRGGGRGERPGGQARRGRGGGRGGAGPRAADGAGRGVPAAGRRMIALRAAL